MKIIGWFLAGVALTAGAITAVVVAGEMVDTEWRENDSANLFFADVRP